MENVSAAILMVGSWDHDAFLAAISFMKTVMIATLIIQIDTITGLEALRVLMAIT